MAQTSRHVEYRSRAEEIVGVSYGTCFYTPGDKLGTLKARWRSADMPEGQIGTGLATGGPTDGSLAGTYEVTYFKPDGTRDATFQLNIKQVGESYTLYWAIDDQIVCEGTGLMAGGGIALAYQNT